MTRLGEPPVVRRQSVGAEIDAEDPARGVHFRVWAPGRRHVEVLLAPPDAAPAGDRNGRAPSFPESARPLPLSPEEEGYFSGLAAEATAGTRYMFRLDGEVTCPDPASRFQPEGPHGPSEVVDPSFRWTDAAWAGEDLDGQVLYELHVGTFTQEGSWTAAAARLPQLAETGFTSILLLPVCDFHGQFGWGYDGVNLFAPTRLYGRPDDFRAFVDRAHSLGLGVILDVVYNHLGAVGNYLRDYTEDYFSGRYRTEWGEALNFDGENSGPVRELLLANAEYWVREFHLDGFRVDAANEIHDGSPRHILTELIDRARRAAGERRLLFIAENEAQDSELIRPPEDGGRGFDASWNEDFHHAVMVALTGRREAYYTDYEGRPQEFVSLARRGFLFQGQRYRWQNKRRGTPALDLPPRTFVSYLQNHDQVANTPRGERLHQLVGPGSLRAITAYFLLGPSTPLVFQGQEFGSSSPFLYFADLPAELADATREGRAGHLAQFRSLGTEEMRTVFPDPLDRASFERSKLDHGERERHPPLLALHRDLIRLRRGDPAIRRAGTHPPEGAVVGPEAFVLRYAHQEGDDRLLLVNLGRELRLEVAPEPLLAPPANREWAILWSSEAPEYGGWGTPPLETAEGWRIPARAAVLLAPRTAP